MKFNGKNVRWWEPILILLGLLYICWFMLTGGTH